MRDLKFVKTKGGAWAVLGPASLLEPGANVTVRKADGSSVQVSIASVGKPFVKDGAVLVYGYVKKGRTR